ncbi:flagellar hook-basal body complex protein [Desulfofundulus thermocisternus]|uniref:flagellar hook-basal body complex protein n=1 Tax=Desulfofundulus thermocisternus TaxID=42471 RepID=UPI0006915277|nr:flagellar hook-basal body complex protein [Desulfofundulus thermocisternus]
MIRSLFSGVSGMKSHQIRMDVIGNNIANVNTVGFKRGQVNFQDTLYQVLKGAGISTNPVQVGLGVAVSSITNNMSPGTLQYTGRTLDLAINGDGFFKVRDPVNENVYYYTRDGVFYIDALGYIVNADGYRLVGKIGNITAAKSTEQFSKIDINEILPPNEELKTSSYELTGQNEINFDFTNVITRSIKVYKDGQQITDYALDPDNNRIVFDNSITGNIIVSYVEKQIPLTLQVIRSDGTFGPRKDFNILVADVATVNAGENYTIAKDATTTLSNLGFNEGDIIEFTVDNSYNGTTKNFSIRIGQNQDLDMGVLTTSSTLADLEVAIENMSQKTGTGVEMFYTQNGYEVDDKTNFDGSGDEGFGFRTIDGGPGIRLTVSVKDINGLKNIFNGVNSDFSEGNASKTGTGDDIYSIINKINNESSTVGVKASLDSNNCLTLKTLYTEPNVLLSVSGEAAEKLGIKPGNYSQKIEEHGERLLRINMHNNGDVASINIAVDGTITGITKAGNNIEWENPGAVNSADFAQICLYTFRNQDGLQRANKNLFKPTESSGDPSPPGKPGAIGYGTIASGYLEMSNVDLTDEFTNMITTQRGYQASARMITVSDTMLEELLNLKR